jgi:hypothetical protein
MSSAVVTTIVPPAVQAAGGFGEVKEGEQEPHFHTTVECIILTAPDFVVWLDRRLDTYWVVDDGYDSFAIDFGKVLLRLAEVESIPIGMLPRDKQLSCRRLVAEAVARALDDRKVDAALGVLDKAEAMIRTRLAETARVWYLCSGLFGIAAGSAVAALAFAIGDIEFATAFSSTAGFAIPLCFGTIGAGFSLISRMGSFPADPSAGRLPHALEATARLVVGTIGALLVVLATFGGVLLPGTTTPGAAGVAGFATVLLLSFVAGSSERFVPNLIGRLDGSKDAPPAKPPASPPA